MAPDLTGARGGRYDFYAINNLAIFVFDYNAQLRVNRGWFHFRANLPDPNTRRSNRNADPRNNSCHLYGQAQDPHSTGMGGKARLFPSRCLLHTYTVDVQSGMQYTC